MEQDSRRDFLQFLAEHDVPAFVRRAQGVREAWNRVLLECETARDELLNMPMLRLGVLEKTIAGQWELLGDLLADAQMADTLADYFTEWNPRLAVNVAASTDRETWRQQLNLVCESFIRFNRRWMKFVDEYDLSKLNHIRDGYNKYYVIEKSCAFASDRIGEEGFEELPLATPAELLDAFPLLHIPVLKND